MEKDELKNYIEQIAVENNFTLKNVDKIVNAKFLMLDDVKRCPCDATNPERYCGSPKCIEDTIKDGHCHCNMFWSKSVDNTDI